MTSIGGAVTKAIIFTLTLFALSTATGNACNYYASPTGAGNGLSQSSPFKISNFWSVAGPGKTLCLLDGTYTGTDSIINPPQNLKGVSGSPITVMALNDGKVLINGQGSNQAVHLLHNDWFVVQGLNACCSNADVVYISYSMHNIIRRVVAWDAADKNNMIFGIANGSSYTLLEDIAGFGVARKIFEPSGGSNYVTVRRFWGRWDGSHFVGPKMTLSLAYDNTDILVENSIGTWSGSAMKQTYTLACDPGTPYRLCGKTFTNYEVDQPQGIFSIDGITTGDKNARARLLGSIAYVQDNDKYPYSYLYLINRLDSISLENNVAYIKPGFHKNVRPFGLAAEDVAGNRLVANKLTSFGTSASSMSGWRTTNILHGISAPAIYSSGESIFNTRRGANLCYQYQDGARSSKPLWPWPMNQRILDAMSQSGHRPVDVTATIEAMFGAIPIQCKSKSTP